MSKAMSLKARIRNIAKQKNISAQVILQNWVKYRKQFAYAEKIEYGQIIDVLKALME